MVVEISHVESRGERWSFEAQYKSERDVLYFAECAWAEALRKSVRKSLNHKNLHGLLTLKEIDG